MCCFAFLTLPLILSNETDLRCINMCILNCGFEDLGTQLCLGFNHTITICHHLCKDQPLWYYCIDERGGRRGEKKLILICIYDSRHAARLNPNKISGNIFPVNQVICESIEGIREKPK